MGVAPFPERLSFDRGTNAEDGDVTIGKRSYKKGTPRRDAPRISLRRFIP
jgi:hypothetical protein